MAALYMKIPKDPDGIKDTVVFKLTKRQLIFYSIGLALGFTAYYLSYKSLGTTTAAVLLFICVSPFFIGAGYEKNGLVMEKYIGNIIRYRICPKMRPYSTENIYRQIEDNIELLKEVEMLETGRKKVKSGG